LKDDDDDDITVGKLGHASNSTRWKHRAQSSLKPNLYTVSAQMVPLDCYITKLTALFQ